MLLHDLLDYSAREHADDPFAVEGDRRITYREAVADTNRLANALLRAGLCIGDRIAILAKNSIEYVLLYFAASRSGVVPVPLNTRLAPAEWRSMLDDAQVRLLLAGRDYVNAVQAVRADLKTVERFIVLDGGAASGWEDYRSWVAACPATTPTMPIADRDDLCQMYTSGTTGLPKGAVLSHSAVTSNVIQLARAGRLEPGERCLLVVPLFQAVGAVGQAFIVAYMGGCLYVQPEFNPFEAVRALSEEGITFTFLAPAMLQAILLAVPDVAQGRYERLRLMAYGGSPIAEQTLNRAVELFSCDFLQVYGMVEATVALSALSPVDHQRGLAEKPGLLLSAGRPLVGTDLAIVDEDGTRVPNGIPGEVVARGPQLMRGYWGSRTETAAAQRDGWLHTGDIGTMDDEGYLFLRDRASDVIMSGGRPTRLGRSGG